MQCCCSFVSEWPVQKSVAPRLCTMSKVSKRFFTYTLCSHGQRITTFTILQSIYYIRCWHTTEVIIADPASELYTSLQMCQGLNMDRVQKYAKLQSQGMARKEHNCVIPLKKVLDMEKDITLTIVSTMQQVLDRVWSEMMSNIPAKEESVVCELQKGT